MIVRPARRTAPVPFASGPLPASTPPPRHSAPLSAQPRARSLSARYLGLGALRVLSTHTGRQYVFDGCGAAQSVDPRDELMLRRLPDLWVG